MWLLYVLLLIIVVLYWFSKRNFNYWEKKKVPHLKPVPLLGNYGDFILLKTFIGEVVSKICDKFPEEPYIGAYYGTEPTLIVQDPELIKLILVKDFYYFNGREVSDYAGREPITKNIFYEHGDNWKIIHQNLTPSYTTRKMRNMFPLIEKCSRVFEKLLEDDISESNIMEVNNLMARFTMECIGSCAFGVETNVMQKNFKNNPYKVIGDQIFVRSTKSGFKNIFRSIWPFMFYGLGFQIYPPAVNCFFVNLLTQIFKQRDYKPTSRNDFVDLILSLGMNENLTGDSIISLKTGEIKKVSMKIDDVMLAGQCVSFLGAGYETAATALAMTLFEVAKHEEVQEKIFIEIDEFLNKHNNVLNYDCVSELPYLGACIDEAMRLYPVLTILTREVMEEYTFSTGLTVEKGVRIHIPVYHIQRNPIHFPEPEKFRPERFLPEERKNVKPFTYMPFGEGYRICVGQRFAKMQMLAGLVTIFKSYGIELAEGMPENVEFDPRVVIHSPKSGVNVKFVPRKDGRNYQKVILI